MFKWIWLLHFTQKYSSIICSCLCQCICPKTYNKSALPKSTQVHCGAASPSMDICIYGLYILLPESVWFSFSLKQIWFIKIWRSSGSERHTRTSEDTHRPMDVFSTLSGTFSMDRLYNNRYVFNYTEHRYVADINMWHCISVYPREGPLICSSPSRSFFFHERGFDVFPNLVHGSKDRGCRNYTDYKAVWWNNVHNLGLN